MRRVKNGRAGWRRGKMPEIVVKNGKPSAVILDIDDYEELLEELEDFEDIKILEKMRKSHLKFRPFSEFLREIGSSV